MLAIDRLSRVPVYEQVIDGIKREILAGILSAGDRLPSVREMSLSLSINPNTIQKAYAELDRRGIIVTYPARGAFVAEDAICAIRAERGELVASLGELVCEMIDAGIDEGAAIDE